MLDQYYMYSGSELSFNLQKVGCVTILPGKKPWVDLRLEIVLGNYPRPWAIILVHLAENYDCRKLFQCYCVFRELREVGESSMKLENTQKQWVRISSRIGSNSIDFYFYVNCSSVFVNQYDIVKLTYLEYIIL